VAAEARTARQIRGLGTVVGDLTSVASARLLVFALSLGGSIATTHVLAPNDYAVIAYMSLGTMLLLFACSGWTSAAVARYGREELERTEGMRAAFWARALITVPIIAAACVLLVSLEAAGVLPDEFTWPFLWMTLAIGVLGVACDQMIVGLEAFGRMRTGARAGAIRQVLLFIGLVALAIDGSRRTPETVALLILAVALLLTAGLVVAIARHGLWPPLVDRSQLRRMLMFSLPLLAFSASQYGLSSVDLVVLRVFREPADVGVYALAYTGYAALQSLAASLTVVLIPLFVSLREGGRSQLIVRYFERLMPSAILAASASGGLLAPIGALAVPLVFGNGFEHAADPFAILVAAAMLLTIASAVAPILMLHERTRATAAIAVAALAVNVAGDLILVGWVGLGVDGPAIATTVALAVIAGGYVIVARRDLGTSPAVNPVLFAPLLAGVLPTALGSAPLGLACSLIATALVLALWPPFGADDAELIRRLDLPRPVRERLARLVKRLAH
jgi:O-antigen/teichoic acid export membrane protein